jgi:hypothetical protein
MKTLPSEEALVAAYWRQLARSIEPVRKSRGRARQHTETSPRATGRRRGERLSQAVRDLHIRFGF